MNTNAVALRWLRRAARAVGVLGAAVWLFAMLASGISDLSASQPASLEGIALAILILTSALAVAVSWRSEALGTAALIGSGLALSIFALVTAGRNKLFAAAVSGGPFLLSGLLLLVYLRGMRSLKAASNS